MKRQKYRAFLLLLPFGLIMLLIASAVVNVIIQSLGYIPALGMRNITLDYYKDILGRPELLPALAVSLRISVLASLGAAVLGTAVCAAMVKQSGNGVILRRLVRLPILVPHAVVAAFTVMLFSQTGMAARLAFACGLIGDYTEFPSLLYGSGYVAVILGYMWKEIPFVAYFSLALMSSVSDSLGEASENLGASPLYSFMHITLPLSLPAIGKATLIIFIFAFGGYELPLLLGATVPKALPVLTYIDYIKPDFNERPYAMAMNGLTLIVSTVLALIYALLMRRLIRRTGGGA